MSVLPDFQIEALAKAGCIAPFDKEMLQPASYDVRLGTTFRRYRDLPDYQKLPGVAVHSVAPGEDVPPPVIDPLDQESLNQLTRKEVVEEGQVVILSPRECVLGVTKEVVDLPNDLVARVEGKSSLGRLFLAVHITAGYIDPGFRGAITLEMINLNTRPIILKVGMPIAQLGFHMMSSRARKPYSGRYQGDKEATPSKYGEGRGYGGLTDPDGFGN